MSTTQEQIEQALALAGAFYDELLAASDAAGPLYKQKRQEVVRDLQTRFYQQCEAAGMSSLTPRQRVGFEHAKLVPPPSTTEGDQLTRTEERQGLP